MSDQASADSEEHERFLDALELELSVRRRVLYSMAIDGLLQSTVRISTDGSIGTGFLVSHLIDDDGHGHMFLVTNKHVIAGSDDGILRFNYGEKPIESDAVLRPGSVRRQRDMLTYGDAWVWVGHERPDVDVAVMPCEQVLFQAVDETKREFPDIDLRPRNTFIDTRTFPDDVDLSLLPPICEVYVAGYPNGIIDSQFGDPVVRRGISATPHHLDFDGERRFLVDVSIFPGSSGSPVVSLERFNTKEGRLTPMFLGLISSVMVQTDSGAVTLSRESSALIAKTKIRQYLDLGVVEKASSVLECINRYCSRPPSSWLNVSEADRIPRAEN